MIKFGLVQDLSQEWLTKNKSFNVRHQLGYRPCCTYDFLVKWTITRSFLFMEVQPSRQGNSLLNCRVNSSRGFESLYFRQYGKGKQLCCAKQNQCKSNLSRFLKSFLSRFWEFLIKTPDICECSLMVKHLPREQII